MRFVARCFTTVLTLVVCCSFASGQTAVKAAGAEQTTAPANQRVDEAKNNESAPASEPAIWIHLVGGQRMQVDDVIKTTDGVWYTRNNVSTLLDHSRVLRVERVEDRPDKPVPNKPTNTGRWNISDAARVENFFTSRFKRPLPLTAFGQSDLHDRWGLDHRHGMDVGLHPDSVEGKALIKFLQTEEIPFLAFRSSIPGVATGPHIHVGNGSLRMHVRQ